MRWNLTLLLFLFSFSCFSQEPYLFIGTYTSGKSKGIYVYRFNESNGTGTEVSTITAKILLTSACRLMANIYATDENEAGGAVGAYAFEPATGNWLFKFTISQGTCPCYVAEDKTGKWVFAANYCSGNLAALPVNTDGSLAPAAQTIQHYGKGPDTPQQSTAHVHSTILSPDEKFLMVADLGTDREHVYTFHPGQNDPLSESLDSFVSLNPGTGPRHIVFHPSKPLLYILGEISGTIDVFNFDSVSGKLIHLQRIRTTPAYFKELYPRADIHIPAHAKYPSTTNPVYSNTSLFLLWVKMENWRIASMFP
jgi:6-phosphogluconolactonase